MQNHIQDVGLLQGQCSDIRIKAFGHVYHLHRLLLIQSGFFRAMLCGGYAEDLASSSAATYDSNLVEIRFDDPNISRAAFEYCVAKLYGAGPNLVLPPWSNPYDVSVHTASDVLDAPICRADAHPATPRFLLSLIATSIYLNIPSVTSQALTLVLCSVTPHTVTHYLRFSIGQGIEGTDLYKSAARTASQSSAQWDWQLDGPIRSLEHLARQCLRPASCTSQSRSCASSSTSSSLSQHTPSKTSAFDDIVTDFSNKFNVSSSDETFFGPSKGSPRESGSSWAQRGSGTLSASRASDLDKVKRHSTQDPFSHTGKKTAGSEDIPDLCPPKASRKNSPSFHYGSVADRIGEACVCWYAQKGYDSFILIEDKLEPCHGQEIESSINLAREERDLDRLYLLRDRLSCGDVDLLQSVSCARGTLPDPTQYIQAPKIKVWAYPALPSSWLKTMVSSDSFFVRTEAERYDFAKRVVEFRRQQKESIHAQIALIERYVRELTPAVDDRGNTKSGHTDWAPKHNDHSALGTKHSRKGSFGSFADSEISDTSSDDALTMTDTEDEDEEEYTELFASGIYYSHMSFLELNRISQDISPTTGSLYAPMHVLQAALWVSNELRDHVLLSERPHPQAAHAHAGPHREADGALQQVHSEQDIDAHSELGVSSGLYEFQRALDLHLSMQAVKSKARSRSATPFDLRQSPLTLSSQSSMSLGGAAEQPLLSGGRSGKSMILKNRYYLVTSDDTVRFGDGLISVVGLNVSATQAQTTPRRAHEKRTEASQDAIVDDLGPTGLAILQMPHTVPVDSLSHRDCGHSSNPKKHRDFYFGIANDVATGRELGEMARKLDASGGTVESLSSPSPASRFSDRTPDHCNGDAPSVNSLYGSDDRWTAFEPMRIGVEFFGIDKLTEKQRLYSPTFFYAGSLWNLYIQLVRKTKGVQLGIYLHRQSPAEDFPLPSAPSPSDAEALPSTLQDADLPVQRRRAGFISPSTPRRALRTGDISATPEYRMSGNDAASHLRGDAQRFQAAGQGLDAGSSESAAARSFFDTSLLGESPLRGAGRHTQSSPLNSSNVGSTISLPGGQTVTSLLGPAGTMFNEDEHENATDANAAYSPSSDDAASSVPSVATSAPLLPTLNSTFLRSVPTLAASTTDSTLTSNPDLQPTVPLFPGGPSVLQKCPAPSMPYKDPRPEIRAYFSIHCPSPLGNALTKFSSGPDRFTNSQSWGWKSSSLLGAVYLEDGDLEKGGKSGFWPRFRCVCTIGLV